MRKLIAASFGVALLGLALFVVGMTFARVLNEERPLVAAEVPEPETLLLFGAGLGIIGFALMRRRRS